jgi:putative ABC transport system permease protein
LGGLAAFLAAIGLYGIMAYNVAARSREMGIRMSVGAEPGRLVAMVMRSGMKRVGLGIAIGLGLALPAAQIVRGSLYGVGALDPLTFGSVAVLLTLVAAMAAYLPARRASRVDPTHALKAD